MSLIGSRKASGLLGQPADAAIHEFEVEFGVSLPGDFNEYLRTVNGMALGHDGDMDGEMISFWRLQDIREEHLAHPPEYPHLFSFGDWSVDACMYAIQLNHDMLAASPVYINCDKPIRVADSFAELVLAYLRNDERVLYAKGL